MKQIIFNKGKGWYISATNYKDLSDKAYISLFFPMVDYDEPEYIDNGRGFSVKTINITDAKFTSYKGKVGMTVFKYVEVEDDEHKQAKTTITREQSNNGAEINITEEELPFY